MGPWDLKDIKDAPRKKTHKPTNKKPQTNKPPKIPKTQRKNKPHSRRKIAPEDS